MHVGCVSVYFRQNSESRKSHIFNVQGPVPLLVYYTANPSNKIWKTVLDVGEDNSPLSLYVKVIVYFCRYIINFKTNLKSF